MGRKIVGFFEEIALTIMKASHAWAENNSSGKSSNSACHVHWTRAGKIDHARVPEWVHSSVGQESLWRPECVGHHRIDESNQKEGIIEIGGHLAAFGDGSGHNAWKNKELAREKT